MSMYDQIVDNLHDKCEKKTSAQADQVQKGRRPLKMPKGYDFSVRNVNWEDYKFDENDKQQQEDGGKGGSEKQDKFLEDFLAACADEQEQFEHV